jgi:hypothetical protein
MPGPQKVYQCERRMLAVRLHPAVIDGLRELAYRRRRSLTELLEDLSRDALVGEGLPCPDPRVQADAA